jgi:hypothetical protein
MIHRQKGLKLKVFGWPADEEYGRADALSREAARPRMILGGSIGGNSSERLGTHGCDFVVRILKGLLALAALAGCTAGTLGGEEYLKKVGPKPLRFALVKPALDPAKALPPLIMNESASTNASPAAEFAGPEWEGLPGVDEELIGSEPQPAPAEAGPVPARQVTPEALLQFFTPGRPRGTVITSPVDFAPPAAGQKSSSATYISQ